MAPHHDDKQTNRDIPKVRRGGKPSARYISFCETITGSNHQHQSLSVSQLTRIIGPGKSQRTLSSDKAFRFG